MIKHKKINPNTLEALNKFYSELAEERLNEWMMGFVEKNIKEGMSVLDFGCGMGRDLDYIRRTFKTGSCLGIDISEVAIMRGQMMYPKVSFLQSNKVVGCHDFIVCSQMLEHTDNPFEIMYDLKEALTKGGVLLITVPYPGSTLDNIQMHFWGFDHMDFEFMLPGCEITRVENVMIIIYK